MIFKGIVSKKDYEQWNKQKWPQKIEDIKVYLHLIDDNESDQGVAEFLSLHDVEKIYHDDETVPLETLEDYRDELCWSGFFCCEGALESSNDQDCTWWVKVRKENVNKDPDKIEISVRFTEGD